MQVCHRVLSAHPLAWCYCGGVIAQLLELGVPAHWMRFLFYAQACTELQLNEEALRLYAALGERIFKRSSFIIAQKAIAFHNTRSRKQLCCNTRSRGQFCCLTQGVGSICMRIIAYHNSKSMTSQFYGDNCFHLSIVKSRIKRSKLDFFCAILTLIY